MNPILQVLAIVLDNAALQDEGASLVAAFVQKEVNNPALDKAAGDFLVKVGQKLGGTAA